MALIYELKPYDVNSNTVPYSDWQEGYTGGSSNWNAEMVAPATNQGQNGSDGGGVTVDVQFDPAGDTGGDTGDANQAHDGNWDSGETFLISIDGGITYTITATVDYFFTPNANADTSVMMFTADLDGDGFDEKYAYNMGNGDDLETDIDKTEGGRIKQGMLQQGHIDQFQENTIGFCFVRGSMIACENGDVAIEDLLAGDIVNTLSNGPQVIRWISSTKHGAAEHIKPIRIKAGALAENTPSQDLLVSPAHRMVVSGWRAEMLFGDTEVLVPAKALVNDSTITVANDLAEFEYFHILFDQHEIVMSNGAPSESFYPIPDAIGALESEARAELFALFPELENMSNDTQPKTVRPTISAAEAALLH